jgi:hypothetical protein
MVLICAGPLLGVLDLAQPRQGYDLFYIGIKRSLYKLYDILF